MVGEGGVQGRKDVLELTDTLRGVGYLADRGLATALFIALKLGRPLLLEGEVGVGKTELAKALSVAFDCRLIRLQCYEGIDTHQALYEWDYARQMLHVRTLSADQVQDGEAVSRLFGAEFLLERPLLEAVRAGDQCVLLIDEIDRADDEFEAFLLEILSDNQVTIPEIGTIKAAEPPIVGRRVRPAGRRLASAGVPASGGRAGSFLAVGIAREAPEAGVPVGPRSAPRPVRTAQPGAAGGPRASVPSEVWGAVDRYTSSHPPAAHGR
mgnify:CR=1 FL=1